MLPPKFAPESGFIADQYGHISPQLDMIFFDRAELPTVSLVGNTVVVPVEVSLLTAEVKSTVKTETLEQVAKQRRDMENAETGLKPAYVGIPGRRSLLVPTIVFGFDSELSNDSLREWLKATSGVEGILIVNKLAIFPTFPRESINGESRFGQAVLEAPTEPAELLLAFIGGVYRLLYFLALHNSPGADLNIVNGIIISQSMWFWEGYLSEFHCKLLSR